MLHTPPIKALNDRSAFAEYLIDVEDALQSGFQHEAQIQWRVYTGSCDPSQLGAGGSWKKEVAGFFSDPAVVDLLRRWSVRDGRARPKHPLVGRLLHFGKRLAVDFDPSVVAAADEIDQIELGPIAELRAKEEATHRDPARTYPDALHSEARRIGADVERSVAALFARREELAIQAGFPGYANLASHAGGTSAAEIGRAVRRVDESTRDAWRHLLRSLPSTSWHARALDQATRERDAVPHDGSVQLSSEALWARAKAWFHPWLDAVTLYCGTASASGFCMVLDWPADIRVGVRARVGPDLVPRLTAGTASTLMHEVGHAVHYGMLSALRGRFLNYLLVPPALDEGIAGFTQSLTPFVVSDLGADLRSGVEGNDARRPGFARLWFLRYLIGWVRFEMKAYRTALRRPSALGRLWRSELEKATEVSWEDRHWALDGHGFYTADPMRRYAYLSAEAYAEEMAAAAKSREHDAEEPTPPQFVAAIEQFVSGALRNPKRPRSEVD